ncbi:uncharacterized protein LOC104437384 isoform X2 [Eucalyptus grandis]|uniref:uncharacterized protein LOC104437384 isoform X2 n=2 Tax=Eucalyptus grandis TaxID=71139 RepID=UPI00192ED5EF|nr:uncharacterized protein LOC104437384 isoform X2 [Eucalyptus grandis]
MLVANSFDLWRKDAFFSAAEEVRNPPTCAMESTYRAWAREMREASSPEYLNDLSRDLQIALGTAKWQLEEFERAVRLSDGPHGDKTTTARHGQFIVAIRDQIAHVEAALQEFLSEGGKQPLQWVNLDKEERDDLALFLSGTSELSQIVKDEFTEHGTSLKGFILENYDKKEDVGSNTNAACSSGLIDEGKSLKDGQPNEDVHCMTDLHTKDQADKTSGSRRTWSSPSMGDWRIAVADDEERNNLNSTVVDTPKEKVPRTIFGKNRCGERTQAKSLTRMFNQAFGHCHVLQRQPYSPRSLRFSCSLQFMLALLLTIFLIVPFVFYSS